MSKWTELGMAELESEEFSFRLLTEVDAMINIEMGESVVDAASVPLTPLPRNLSTEETVEEEEGPAATNSPPPPPPPPTTTHTTTSTTTSSLP